MTSSELYVRDIQFRGRGLKLLVNATYSGMAIYMSVKITLRRRCSQYSEPVGRMKDTTYRSKGDFSKWLGPALLLAV